MPQITCVLHGSFEDLLPQNASNNEIMLNLDTPAEIIAHFGINPDMVHYVIVNGQYIQEGDWQTPLSASSNIQFWPRMAGG